MCKKMRKDGFGKEANVCLFLLPKHVYRVVVGGACRYGNAFKVCRHLRIIERDYFGLQYEGTKGETLWINLRNRLGPQLSGAAPHRLRLRVKFLVEPHLLLQDETRHQFYLHVREELRLGRLVCRDDSAVKLAALIMQAELGDYRAPHGGSNNDNAAAVYDRLGGADPASVSESHRALVGCSRATAEYRALQEAAALPGFGVEWHSAWDDAGQRRLLGVGCDGVAVCDAGVALCSDGATRIPLRRIPFPTIHAATQSNKRVVFSVLGDGAEPEETRFRLVSSHAANGLYRAVTEAHAFYRCDTVNDAVTAQYSRDFKGHLASLLLSEDIDLGKRFVFDIRRTCKEVYDHCRRQLYHTAVVGDEGTPGPAGGVAPGRGTPRGCSPGAKTVEDTGTCEPCPSPLESLSAPPTPAQRRCDIRQLEEQLRALQEAMLCSACCHGDIDAAFCPCGHMVCCRGCAARLRACPLCRCDVDRVQHVFLPVCPKLLRLNSEL
ncbi:E3 ubiquitin-protein ligase MYLIP isoform X1 [Lethenteron reissneri]|uniref:E3 ubiquitin-protein ligase MYLIP isoform X1 n=1 Tax=Lethenteron reissneri TaxID=7753 RepID=UPI002AB7DFA3|nr:E3 ubiquitin-protein ligase MYLIP isoform X1 [Lethenteron reissneri]